MSDLRLCWAETAELVHACTAINGHIVGPAHIHADNIKTDCGRDVPVLANVRDKLTVTCEDCLWGGLDGMLAEFVSEPVAAIAVAPARKREPVFTEVRRRGYGI